MIYRKFPVLRKKYMYVNPAPAANSAAMGQAESSFREIEKIPLPNEIENGINLPDQNNDDVGITRNRNKPFLSSVFQNIQPDDIILLGLIFILYQEGIDDEILLILLIYIFLT